MMMSDEDLLKTMLYDCEDLEEKVIYTYLDKEPKFLKKQELMGTLV
jgi:hypothetical protein